MRHGDRYGSKGSTDSVHLQIGDVLSLRCYSSKSVRLGDGSESVTGRIRAEAERSIGTVKDVVYSIVSPMMLSIGLLLTISDCVILYHKYTNSICFWYSTTSIVLTIVYT